MCIHYISMVHINCSSKLHKFISIEIKLSSFVDRIYIVYNLSSRNKSTINNIYSTSVNAV